MRRLLTALLLAPAAALAQTSVSTTGSGVSGGTTITIQGFGASRNTWSGWYWSHGQTLWWSNPRTTFYPPLASRHPLGIHVTRSPYQYVGPWQGRLLGADAYYYGYPPHYGPPARSYGGPWISGPHAVYWGQRFNSLPVREAVRRLDPATGQFVPTTPQMAPPAAQPGAAAPAPEPSAWELAGQALASADYSRAAITFARLHDERRALEASPAAARLPDRSAQRLLAIALLGNDQPDEAATQLAAAHAADPSLMFRGLGADLPPIPRAERRRLVLQAVNAANQRPSHASWLLVADLMQAEGRLVQAQKMYERAEQLRAASPSTGGAAPSSAGAQPATSGPGAEPTSTREPNERPAGPASFSMPRPTAPQPADAPASLPEPPASLH